MALVVDTGPLYAALDRSDDLHLASLDLLTGTNEPLVIPSPVLVEVDQLVGARLHSGIWTAFLADVIANVFVILDLAEDDYVRVRELCVKYSDLDLGLVDASVVAIAERLNEPKIATLDHRHFRAIRPRHVEAFELLPR